MPALTTADFSFAEPLGSDGATIEQLGTNHFKVTLGAAPGHPEWCNKLQFRIVRHAKGNALKLEVEFPGGPGMALNEYFHSFSYDGETWQPVGWVQGYRESPQRDRLEFPEFTQDQVIVGHQVPMSYETACDLTAAWARHPAVSVVEIGCSQDGTPIERLTISAPDSPHPPSRRWIHHISNQHPGEFCTQWRMAGMIDWLLSDEAAECRQRSISHFVLFMSPDGPRHGWYRVNRDGVDMNRSYRAAGADPREQTQEAYILQSDLERLMASAAPVTDLWSMHTWQGIVEPLLTPGPEMAALGGWTRFRDILAKHDATGLIKPLDIRGDTSFGTTTWTAGPHAQFGISVVLCEGAGNIETRAENLLTGEVIMKALAEFYQGLRG